MIRRLAGVAITFVLVAHASEVYACSSVPPRRLVPPPILSEAPDDEVAPPEEVIVAITRGDSEYVDSCSDLGFVSIRIKPQQWVDLPLSGLPLEFGYVFELVESTINELNYLDLDEDAASPPVAQDGYYRFSLTWIDGIRADREPAAITLRVYAVDRWGRRSEPVTVSAQDPGTGRLRQ